MQLTVEVLSEEIAAVNVFLCGLYVFKINISWFIFWSLSMISLLDHGDVIKGSFTHTALVISEISIAGSLLLLLVRRFCDHSWNVIKLAQNRSSLSKLRKARATEYTTAPWALPRCCWIPVVHRKGSCFCRITHSSKPAINGNHSETRGSAATKPKEAEWNTAFFLQKQYLSAERYLKFSEPVKKKPAQWGIWLLVLFLVVCVLHWVFIGWNSELP